MEVNNTTSRQEHWWFLMRQRASGTVNPEMKKPNIYMFSQIFCFLFLLYKCQKRISWWCPSRFRFRTSPCYLMVVLLPSWGKNKCRALIHAQTFSQGNGFESLTQSEDGGNQINWFAKYSFCHHGYWHVWVLCLVRLLCVCWVEHWNENVVILTKF